MLLAFLTLWILLGLFTDLLNVACDMFIQFTVDISNGFCHFDL